MAAEYTLKVKEGDRVPEGTLWHSGNPEDDDACALPQKFSISERVKGKKVVIFSVPASFSPTCSEKHVPGFVEKANDLKSKGIDEVICLSADTVWSQDAWGKKLKVGTKVLMASDPYGEFSDKLGLKFETHEGQFRLPMGPRTRRYILLLDDGIIKYIAVDAAGLEATSAEAVLARL
ncbi:hypothetical protein HK097_007290 [Rhizophlyctis rosea]|uniref:Thioredoxin domain-containing protein n=1 Tax=Rhizophlyctis rosea TaxID=64517 RepID=A0AAD5X4N8_9FUNG|nr:hypothetical protein HK097_007290 [Rhizophlyctis rosea]